MKIGIYGGAFNPPHKMHKNIVSSLIKKKYIDKAIVVPVSDDYTKKDLLCGKDRLAMLNSMFKNNKNVNVSSFEIDGSLYTINTLNYFKGQYPKADIYFILGTDNLSEFFKWKKYEEILKNFKLLVVSRDGSDFKKELEKFKKFEDRIILAQIKPNSISSTIVREEIIKRGYTENLKRYLYVDTIKYLKKINARAFWKNS